MVAPEAESVFAVTETPSVSLSPDTTVYPNTKALVPEPLMYEAERVVAPTNSEIVGVPVTVTASEKLTVTRIESAAT